MQWGVSRERDHGEKMGSPIEACSEEWPLGDTDRAGRGEVRAPSKLSTGSNEGEGG